ELRPDHAAVPVATAQSPDVTNFLATISGGKPPQGYQDDGTEFTLVESDEYFAWQLQRAGMAVLASERGVPPHALFAANAFPPGVPPRAKPFTLERVWHMGIVLAARELGLDLNAATVDLPGGKIIFRSKSGTERVVPVDRDGYFLINWELPFTDARVAKEPIE